MTMRVGIQGWGSEGDLRPLVALAARLCSEGHLPRLVLTSVDGKDYVQLCRALDVPLRVVPEKMEFSLEGLALDATSADPSKLLRAVLDLGFSPYVEAMYQAALDLCRTSDVVVGGSSSFLRQGGGIEDRDSLRRRGLLPRGCSVAIHSSARARRLGMVQPPAMGLPPFAVRHGLPKGSGEVLRREGAAAHPAHDP